MILRHKLKYARLKTVLEKKILEVKKKSLYSYHSLQQAPKKFSITQSP